jgi:predicted site-specific integrase-resolvase
MNHQALSIGEISSIFGISISTLRRWDHVKLLMHSFTTPGGHRRYHLDKVARFFGLRKNKSSEKRITVAYSRVSSSDQRDDLKRQENHLHTILKKRRIASYLLISDLGSGINYRKKGLKKLMALILQNKVKRIIITHKDRLLRFGFQLIETICQFFGTQIEVLDKSENDDFEVALAKDVLEIVTVFSSRLYGRRSHQKKS